MAGHKQYQTRGAPRGRGTYRGRGTMRGMNQRGMNPRGGTFVRTQGGYIQKYQKNYVPRGTGMVRIIILKEIFLRPFSKKQQPKYWGNDYPHIILRMLRTFDDENQVKK